MRWARRVSLGVVASGLACGGGPSMTEEPRVAQRQARPAPAPLDPLEPVEGGPELDCPDGTVPYREERDGLTQWGCAWREGRSEILWRGPVRYHRGEREVVRGVLNEYRRVGTWRAMGPSGEILAEGAYDEKGHPTGRWVFPSGPREFQPEVGFTPDTWSQAAFAVTPADTWGVDVLDADLERGFVALKTTWEANMAEREPPEPCSYPGLASPVAGVQLEVHPTGGRGLLWSVYEPAGEGDACTSEAEAGRHLAAAKEAMAEVGLNPTVRTPLAPVVVDEAPDGIREGAWSFEVPGHDVTLVRTERPGIDVELATPGLAHRDWAYTAYERVHFYTLSVDDVPVHRFVFTTTTSCAGSGHLQPRGLVVQGARAALVLTAVLSGCKGAAMQNHVGPVVSLERPEPWAW